jgi:predicted Zn-dependent protease
VTSVLTRCALVAVALLAGAWLVLGVRALDLQSDAESVRSGPQGAALTPDDADRARSFLHRARLLSVDKSPLLNEGVLLLATGRREEGVAILERVVAEEPDNLEAWIVLYNVYSRSSDAKRAREALRRIRALNPLAEEAL